MQKTEKNNKNLKSPKTVLSVRKYGKGNKGRFKEKSNLFNFNIEFSFNN